MKPAVSRLLKGSGIALLLVFFASTWTFLNRWNRIVRLEESVARPLEFDYFSGPVSSSSPRSGLFIGWIHDFLRWSFKDNEPKPPIHGWTVTYGRNSPNRLQASLLGPIDKIRIYYTDIYGPDFGPALEDFDDLFELQLYGDYFDSQKDDDLNLLLGSVAKLPKLQSFEFNTSRLNDEMLVALGGSGSLESVTFIGFYVIEGLSIEGFERLFSTSPSLKRLKLEIDGDSKFITDLLPAVEVAAREAGVDLEVSRF
jgi:hypothetical protein